MALFLYVAAGAPALVAIVAALFGFRAMATANIDSFGAHLTCKITLLKFISFTLHARVAFPNGEVFFMERRLNRKPTSNKKSDKMRKKLNAADLLALLRDGGIKLSSLDVSGELGVKGDAAAGVMLSGGAACMLDILAAFLGFESVRIALRPADSGVNWLKLEGIAYIAPAQIIIAAANRRRLQYSRKAAKQRCTQ